MAFLGLMGIQSALSQSFSVSGKVSSQTTGLPLEGATVLVKGTGTSTTTNSSGDFSITVPRAGSVLVISYVNMRTIETVVRSTDNVVSVSLESTGTNLEEVVVNVGYGTQKKSVTTGAISSVRARDLEKVPNGRIEQALQGRVSGVTIMQNSGQPGSPSTIRVRGVTTFDGGNNPLWVVDGIVVGNGGIGYLNQADIESIEVLKDATSAAIYGTRAATGVILVTTKKGRAGKLTVNYNGFYGTSAPAKRLELLNAAQYAAIRNEKSVAGGGGVLFPDLSIYGTGTDWQKAVFNDDARRQSHEISMSGGTDRSTFFISGSLQDQEGIVASDISGYAKKSIRLNSTHKLSNVFTFGQTIGYTHQKSSGIGNTNNEFGGVLSSAINLDPITPLIEYDPVIAAGPIYSDPRIWRDANGNPYGISSMVGQEMTNPLAFINTRLGHHNYSDDIVGNAFLEINVNRNFKFKTNVGAKRAWWGSREFYPISYLSATQITAKNGYNVSRNNVFDWNLENTLQYSNKIKDHDFSILLGQGAYVEGIGGESNTFMQNLPVTYYTDASLNWPVSTADRASGGFDYTKHKLSSLFTRLNYNYKERYIFTGIVRRDGSSRFGANEKYGVFPSASVAWNINRETFWPQNNYVRTFKLRGGYGVVGNDAIREFGYLATIGGVFNYNFGTSGQITTGYAPSSIENPDLRWEETSQLNIGFDAQLFRNFNLTVEVYNKKTSGILREVTIPGYVGVTSNPVRNVADMENKGVEVELGYRTNFGKLAFSASGNVTYLKNKVTFINDDRNFIEGGAGFQSMGNVTRIQVGQSFNSFYGYKTAGIFQTWEEINAYAKSGTLIQPDAKPGDFRWVDTDGDGSITANDRQFLGTSLPKYTFGTTINLEYMGFDLMAFAQGAAGNKIFQGLRRLDIENANYTTRALSRWTGPGTSNDYPRLTTNDQNGNFGKMSDFYLEKGDYLRLKVLQLGYTIPANKYLDKIGATKLRIYLSAENLVTLTDYTGYDPEIGGGVYGIDKGYYPQARSYMAGVQLQF